MGHRCPGPEKKGFMEQADKRVRGCSRGLKQAFSVNRQDM